jgi:hypothetical protein
LISPAPAAGAPVAFARKAVRRGAAFGDIDNDGRVDAVTTALDGASRLWRNVSPVRAALAAGGLVGGVEPRRHGRRHSAAATPACSTTT